jgi:hypothetical protein
VISFCQDFFVIHDMTPGMWNSGAEVVTVAVQQLSKHIPRAVGSAVTLVSHGPHRDWNEGSLCWVGKGSSNLPDQDQSPAMLLCCY